MFELFLKRILPWPIYKFLAGIKGELILLFGYRDFKIISANYDEYWQDKKGYVKKAIFIKNIIQNSSSVLDIGCGDGTTLEILLRNGNVSQLMGVDISELAVEICSKKGIMAIQEDINNKGFIEKLPTFDYIILADTIEHLANPEETMLALKEKFKKGIIVTILNTGFLRYRLRLLFGKFPLQWKIFPGEHLRFWTLRDFRWWIDKLGFRMGKFIPMFGIAILKRIWPNLFCAQMLALLKRK